MSLRPAKLGLSKTQSKGKKQNKTSFSKGNSYANLTNYKILKSGFTAFLKNYYLYEL